jgi:hypothetical protein
MSDSIKSNITLSGFHFDQVDPKPAVLDAAQIHFQKILAVNPGLASILQSITLSRESVSLSSPLGDLTGFTNPTDPSQPMVFAGNGFNTIFRPQSPKSPTQLPFPVPASDNVLELNLTAETLSFSAPLGNVPNRGFGNQPDIFLNGVPYVQTVNDITSGTAVGIHFEPGIWLAVPPTTIPAEAATTYARMASIPHGVTINAQGISLGRISGPPPIGPVNINPFPIGGAQKPSTPGNRFFPNQDVTQQQTARIPQDLTSFVAANTITQAMLDDPNIVLRNHLAGLNVESFVTLVITTDPSGKRPTPPPNPTTPPAPPVTKAPGIGGGTGEIGFLVGDGNAPPTNPNADAFKMTAIFWIEKIRQSLVVPPCKANGLPILIQPPAISGHPFRPTFTLTPTVDITADKTIEVSYTQIQYSQTVFLNFGPLTWPHVSVATLIPASPIVVPPSVW